jgi:hypothetical protein
MVEFGADSARHLKAVTVDVSGPWGRDESTRFLSEAFIPVRLASQGRAGPLVQSLWYVFSDGAIWCATAQTAVLVRRLERDPNVGFEVAGDSPPYRGVRGLGRAHIDKAAATTVLPELLDRYDFTGSGLGDWLLSRVENEVAIRIVPTSMASWDFSDRM